MARPVNDDEIEDLIDEDEAGEPRVDQDRDRSVEEDEPDDGRETADELDGEPDEDEGDSAGQDPPAQDVAPRRRKGQRDGRIERLAARERDANERADRLERELRQAREAQAREAQERADREERQILDRLDPEERREYERGKETQSLKTQLARLQFEGYDRDDKADFRDLVRRNPRYERFAAEVEQDLVKARAAGLNLKRSIILERLVGAEVMKKGGELAGKARKTGARKIAAQRTGGMRAGSDTGRGGRRGTGNSIEDIEARIGDIPLSSQR